jgi:RNA polymerase sigma-70 factor (ECF subfamily)
MTPQLTKFEDSALIEMILAGRTECFSVLMERHMGPVRRCVHSMLRNETESDDILQEVLLKVWRHLSTFRADSSFRTWMTRVATNEVLQAYRRQRLRPLNQCLTDLDSFASSGESPHRSFVRAETADTLRRAVDGLPQIYRQVLILRDIEELSSRETAERLGSPVPTVKTRLFRARTMLSAAVRAGETKPRRRATPRLARQAN